MTAEPRAKPLTGLKVIDFSRVLAGPFCTMLLADLGADVIKVEAPAGDPARAEGPFPDDAPGTPYGGYFQSVNRNKRSVVIDLATDPGRGLAADLCATADVVVENFRVGVMERFGLGYEMLADHNPRLVYGAIRGFGDPRTGASPYSDLPAYDIVAQAMGGLMAITGFPDGPPTKVGPGIGDIFPGVLAATGILAAVHQARATGRGRFIDVAMYDAIVSLCERTIYQYSYRGEVSGRVGNAHPILSPFDVYPTRDGWVAIAAPNGRHWQALCATVGRPELGSDPRYDGNASRVALRAEVRDLVEGWTRERPTAEVVGELAGRVPVGPVNSADAIVHDPHLRARGMLLEVDHPGHDRAVTIAGCPIKYSDAAAAPTRRAPLPGEHTDEVLAEAGLAPTEIAALRTAGAIH